MSLPRNISKKHRRGPRLFDEKGVPVSPDAVAAKLAAAIKKHATGTNITDTTPSLPCANPLRQLYAGLAIDAKVPEKRELALSKAQRWITGNSYKLTEIHHVKGKWMPVLDEWNKSLITETMLDILNDPVFQPDINTLIIPYLSNDYYFGLVGFIDDHSETGTLKNQSLINAFWKRRIGHACWINESYCPDGGHLASAAMPAFTGTQQAVAIAAVAALNDVVNPKTQSLDSADALAEACCALRERTKAEKWNIPDLDNLMASLATHITRDIEAATRNANTWQNLAHSQQALLKKIIHG